MKDIIRPQLPKFKKKASISEMDSVEKFLSQMFLNFKLSNKDFSVKNLGEKIGITSRTELMMIMRGRKKLTPAQIKKISESLDFDKKEKIRLNKIKKPKPSKSSLEMESFIAPADFFADITNVLVLNLCGVQGGISPSELRTEVLKYASLDQLTVSVNYLYEHGLIELRENVFYRVFEGVITTQGHLPSKASHKFTRQVLEMMKSSLEMDPTERELQSFLVRLDKKDFNQAKAIIRECRQRLMKLSKGNKSDSVFLTTLGSMPLYSVEE